MAEERDLALARSPEPPADEEATKAELQRRMEEARESISQTVTEIKETVMNQYQQVRESISDTFDWREQYRRRPVPFTVGAFGTGIILGYCVANAVKGRGNDETEYDEEGAFDRIEQGFDRSMLETRSYAAQPILGAQAAAAGGGSTASYENVYPEPRPAYAAPSAPAEASEPQGPGLLARFKETRAYDRLQDEISTLGNRAVDELSKTAQAVVIPALLNKLKDLIGIDLSTQREVAQRSRLEHEATKSSAGTAAASEGQSSGQGAGGAASAHATGGART